MTDRPFPTSSSKFHGDQTQGRFGDTKEPASLCSLDIFSKKGETRSNSQRTLFGDRPLLGDRGAPDKAGADAGDAARRPQFDPKEAGLLLADNIKNLRLTTDGSLPRLAQFAPDFEVKAKTTVEDLAKARLGPKASKAQIDLFVKQLAEANPELEIKSVDDDLDAGQRITVPGQDRSGGIYRESHGKRTTTWSNGSSEENSPDTLKINIKGEDREYQFLFSNNTEDGPSFKKVIKGDSIHELREDGLQIFSTRGKGDEPDRVDRVIKPDKSDCKISYDKDTGERNKITLAKPGSAPVEFSPNDIGEFVSRDGKKGFTADEAGFPTLYDRKVNKDGSVNRTFEDKSEKKFDKDGKLTHSLERPDEGFKIERFFKPGEEKPDRVLIEHEKLNRHLGRRGPLELTKTPTGRYTATIKSDDGRTKLGTVEISKENTVSYVRTKDRSSVHWILPGDKSDISRTVSTTPLPDHAVRTDTVDGEGGRSSRVSDRMKLKKSETYTSPGGMQWQRQINTDGKEVQSLKVNDRANGFELDLKLDRSLHMLQGTVKEKGETKEATLCRDTLLIKNKDGTMEARRLIWAPGNEPEMVKGKFDPDNATFTSEMTLDGKNQTVRESIIPGMTDVLGPGRTITGTMANGVQSSINFMGEAIVERPDGTAVKLGPDNLVDVWDRDGKNSVRGEPLLDEARKFLEKYPDTDRRLVAEIHRRFRPDAESRDKADRLFKKLGEIESIKGLSTDQKKALRNSIFTHVAFPESIVQGEPTFVCGAATVQRNLAIDHPDVYASTLVSALSGSPLKNIAGKDVKLNQANLVMHDTTGRDIASRAFQTTAANLLFGKLRFENTSDGVGKLLDPEGRKREFNGMGLDRMALLLKSLTNEPKAAVMVTNEADLVRLFKENKGKSMPLSCNPDSELGHVYNLVGIDEGPPVRLRIQDHAGLTRDMSGPQTALKNLDEIFGKRGEAMVIFGGHGIKDADRHALDPNKAYKVEDGKVVVDKKLTEEFAQEREKEDES